MSEREPGIGAFVLGIGVGVILGILFAPAGGDAVRAKLARRLHGLRDLAADKAGDLGALVVDVVSADDGPVHRAARSRGSRNARSRRRAGREDEPAG